MRGALAYGYFKSGCIFLGRVIAACATYGANAGDVVALTPQNKKADRDCRSASDG